MSHQSFDDQAQDLFLPPMQQDESLDSVLQHPTFTSYEHDSLESLSLPSPEPLPFDHSGPTSTTAPTTSISSHPLEASANINHHSQDFPDVLQQPTYNSEPCTPQLQHSTRSGNYFHHATYNNNPGYPLSNDHLTYNPGIHQPNIFPPQHILHQRAHSQPPEVTFFRAPHQSSRSTTRTLTGGIPLSNSPGPVYNSNQAHPNGIPLSKHAPRYRDHPYRDHPYRSSSRSRRHDGGPTSAPPSRMMSSPRPMSSRGVHSPNMQGMLHHGNSPMYMRMQTPEEQSASANTAQMMSALGDVLVNAGGTVSPAQMAVVLGFVDEVERKQRETLAGCERIRGLFGKGGEVDGDVEPLKLDGASEALSQVVGAQEGGEAVAKREGLVGGDL
ncbi:hypothetical protein BU16DRAFT_532610 [Lophium mytilinum]|uniref:Uncharacterized protein n=1 Tax=Lophium mytilinum TaxID=390894 RepID=A0A6A6RCQ3_9PEZI|nr:hypothetical protein BU16DRAFT_532610 [Lophium mytilinum]